MVRNLMLIVGVSVSLMAFGCSSDDGSAGSGGAAGTGGSAGAGGAGGDAGAGGAGGAGGGGVTDACTNVDDAAIVCDPGFADEVTDCATTAQGDAAATATCLGTATGVSAPCASCYGNFSECSRDECALGGDQSCLPPGFGGDFGPGTPECEACTAAAGCDSARDACTGNLEVACE